MIYLGRGNKRVTFAVVFVNNSPRRRGVQFSRKGSYL